MSTPRASDVPDVPDVPTGQESRAEREPASSAASGRRAFATSSGIPLEPVYGAPGDGAPGIFPFTRGIHASMYRSRAWTMRQYAGFGSARATNERFKLLLASGQTGLSTAFDLPTQIGYDSDHPLAEPEVGAVGVPVNSLRDVELLLEGIPLEEVSTSMTINATAPILLAMVVAAGKRRGVAPEKLRGTVQNDILKEYAARGNYRFEVEPSMRLTTDLVAWCAKRVPQWNTISISGYHMREAGCTAVQEVAFTLANGKAYVRAALAAGMAIDDFAPRLSFFFNAHNQLFEEVAKFRAARRLWARIVRQEFGAKQDESCRLRFHAQTAGSTLTSQQPENNAVRVAIQALAAVLGGCQSLHTNSRDEALSLPSEASARLALRTQQILAHESGVADVVDPLGGSPLVESLTDEIESRAVELMAEVERRGGAVRAIEAGWIQRQIHESALAWQRRVERGEEIVVGVNKHQVDEPPPAIFRPDPAARAQVFADLAAVRAQRDASAVEARLAALGLAARGTSNLMEPILAAVEAWATIGEICGVLERTFGAWRAPRVV